MRVIVFEINSSTTIR